MPCSTASRIVSLMDADSPPPPTASVAANVSTIRPSQTTRNRVRFFFSIRITSFYFSGMNIMPKLTDSSTQQTQITRSPNAAASTLPSPAPTPNTKITPK